MNWINLEEASRRLEEAGENSKITDLIHQGEVEAAIWSVITVDGASAREWAEASQIPTDTWPEGRLTATQLANVSGLAQKDVLALVERGFVDATCKTHYTVNADSLSEWIARAKRLTLQDVRTEKGWSKVELFCEVAAGRLRVQGSGASRYVLASDLEKWPQDYLLRDFNKSKLTASVHSPKNFNQGSVVPSVLLDVVYAPIDGGYGWQLDTLGQAHQALSPFVIRLSEYVRLQNGRDKNLYALDWFLANMSSLDEQTLCRMLEKAGEDVEEGADKRELLAVMADRLGVDLLPCLDTYTVDDAAAILGVSSKTIYRRIDDGELEVSHKDGRSYAISRDALRRFKGKPLFGGEL